MFARTFRTCFLSAGLAAMLAVSSVTLVAMSGPALADADGNRGSGALESDDGSKPKASGKKKAKGSKKPKRGNGRVKDAPFRRGKDDAPKILLDAATVQGGEDARDDRQQQGGSANDKRSKSPSWSKRAAPPKPPRMIPLPASDFSGSDLAPDRSVRPQTRSG